MKRYVMERCCGGRHVSVTVHTTSYHACNACGGGVDSAGICHWCRTGKAPTRAALAAVGELAEEVSIGPLEHLVRHSPDGFEWGYHGSGPADLARSIVGDVMDDPDPPPTQYQLVKSELVARIPKEGGEITEAEVLGVLAS